MSLLATTGNLADWLSRLKALAPFGWFGNQGTPIQDGVLSAPAQAFSGNYSLLEFVQQQTRIATATGLYLDLIGNDFFGGKLPRQTNENDASYRARIYGNLFVNGPTRADMARVLTLVTGRVPSIFEPSNTNDSGGWDGGLYWDDAGGWGDPLSYQGFVTAYRPNTGQIDLGEWDARNYWDAAGAWSDNPNSIADAAIIAAVQATKPLGTLIWMRIADAPVTP